MKKLISCIVILFFVFNTTILCAQLSNEQQNQLNQYSSLIDNYKRKKKYRMVGYYLYKSASVHLNAGEHQNAIDKFLESANYYEQIGSYSNKKKIYSNIAFVYTEMGQLKNAKKYYYKSLEISRRLNNRNDISASLMEVATIEIYLQDYTKANVNLEQALKIANSLNDAILLKTCYQKLAQLYKAKGDKKKSDQYYDNFLAFENRVKDIKLEDEADKIVNSEKEKSKTLLEKQELNALKYELLELKKKLLKDSLSSVIPDAEDTFAEIIKLKQEIILQNELLNQEKKITKSTKGKQKLKIEKQQLYIKVAMAGIILLFFTILAAVFYIIKLRKTNKLLKRQI